MLFSRITHQKSNTSAIDTYLRRILTVNVLFLAACGSDSSDSPMTTAPSTQPAIFTESNADAAAEQAWSAVQSVASVYDLSQVSTNPEQATNRLKAQQLIQLDVDCQPSGRFSYAFDDADDSGLFPQLWTSGDSQTLEFTACQLAGQQLDGTMMTDWDQVESGSGFIPTSMSMTFMLDLAIAESGVTTTLTGDISTQFSFTNNVTTLTYAGTELDISMGTNSLMRLTDFDLNVVTNNSVSPATVTSNIDATLAATDIGQFQIATLVPLISSAGGYPTSGQLVLASEDENGSTAVRLTAISDGESVLVEIDVNGDGVYDIENTKLWSEL